MSGTQVAYHLRQNKAIDRNLFIDLLSRLSKNIPIQKYEYISMGGPYLEDFKLIHSHFGLNRMISLEGDRRVIKRQKFNKPLSCIKLRHTTSGAFIDSYDFDYPVIMWLDYTSPRNFGTQLQEVERVIGKLGDYDVLKVTVNASLEAVQNIIKEEPTASEVEKIVRSRVGNDYLPQDIDPDLLEDSYEYPKLVLKAVERATKRGVRGKPGSIFQPLSAYLYADGPHRMLTVSGTLLPVGEVKKFIDNAGLRKWPQALLEWSEHYTEPQEIAIPDLSLRERLYFDARLPKLASSEASRRQVSRAMEHVFPAGARNAERGIDQYVQFYRHFPYMSKIIV